MRILTVSYSDIGGGADRVAHNLSTAYALRDNHSWMAVAKRQSDNDSVIELANFRQTSIVKRGLWSLYGRLAARDRGEGTVNAIRKGLSQLANGRASINRYLGRDVSPRHTERDLLITSASYPDIIHCHTLHGDYFDLSALSSLSNRFPLVATLHDLWMLTGHCAHSLDCQKWKTGCGSCPYLDIYPSIRRDATAHNWRRKRNIYNKCRLYLAAPSNWLMLKLENSILQPAIIDMRVIPNGVDLSIFQVGNTLNARSDLNLPIDDLIILFAANSITNNPWKDFTTMRDVIAQISLKLHDHRILFIALGENAPDTEFGSARVQFVPYQNDPKIVARYYQAADIYLHGARVDTFPMTILEAMACGIPVVASDVGGIPEQVEEGHTGFLSPVGDVESMVYHLEKLILDPDLRSRLGKSAAVLARAEYDLNLQVSRYLDWFSEIVE